MSVHAMLLILTLLCLIVCSISNGIYEYKFYGPVETVWNKKIATISMKNNIYIDFDMILKDDAFSKPSSEVDNIFQIGSDSLNYYPALFINIQRKQMFFRFTTNAKEFNFINIPYHDKIRRGYLYHIIMKKSQTTLNIIVNNKVIYNNDDMKINNNILPVSQPLYVSNSQNNAASVNISNFTLISSDTGITSAHIAQKSTGIQESIVIFDKSEQTHNVIESEESEESVEQTVNSIQTKSPVVKDNMHCGFNGSFKTEQNVIIDSININAYIYLSFDVKFYKNINTMDPEDFESESAEEYESVSNILHIGESQPKSYPTIDYYESTNKMSFKFIGISQQTDFKITTGKTYKIELYKTLSRYQISINKQNIYDSSLINFRHTHLHITNQPIYMSNPWSPSANVKISNFMVKSSSNNITNGEHMMYYKYPYCLRLHNHKSDVKFNGIYYPNGTYNNHHMFTKSYLPELNRPFIHLFYFDRSWRIYKELYNKSDYVNDPKPWFLKCDVDDFNVLACNRNFHYQSNNFNDGKFSIIYGFCDVLTKTPPPTREPTPEPTLRPTFTPTAEPTPEPTVITNVNINMHSDTLTWEIVSVTFGVLWVVVIIFVVLMSIKVFRDGKYDIAAYIYFPGNQKYYQTNLKTDGEGNEETDIY